MSLENAYAYVLLGSLTSEAPSKEDPKSWGAPPVSETLGFIAFVGGLGGLGV